MRVKSIPSVIFVVVTILMMTRAYISDAADLAACPTCAYTTIQSAVDAAGAGDRVVVGTPGRPVVETYNESVALKSGVDLVSQGDDTTYEVYDDPYRVQDIHVKQVLQRTNRTVIQGDVTISGTFAEDIVLDGFTIQGKVEVDNNSPIIRNNVVRGGSLLVQGSVSPITPLIEDNLVHDAGSGMRGIGSGSYSNATIQNNECWGDQTTGIGLNPGPEAVSPDILFNYSHHNNTGGIGSSDLSSGSTVTIQGNTLYQNGLGSTGAGIMLQSTTGGVQVIINLGNQIHSNRLAGINLQGLDQVTIGNNEIYANGRVGINLETINQVTIDNNNIHSNTRAGIRILDAGPVTVSNNDIYGNTWSGIRLESMDQADISDNHIHTNSKAGIYVEDVAVITMNRNTIHNHLNFAGIYLNATAADVIIGDSIANGNEIYDNYGGIFLAATNSQPVLIQGNSIYGNSLGGIRINGSATAKVTIAENTLAQNGRGGITIVSPCSDLEIVKNDIYDNIRGGIHTGEDLADGAGFVGPAGSAVLTIRQNKVHNNGTSGYGNGIDVRHGSGTIDNNLVYENNRGGIRYGDHIDEIVNNTVTGNGNAAIGSGAGIAYDNLAGAVNDPPTGTPPTEIPIKNNIAADNYRAGIRDGLCSSQRNYNLYYGNNGRTTLPMPQIAGCDSNANEIFAEPSFVNKSLDDYRLNSGSPAVDAGDSSYGADASRPPARGSAVIDMGAYGGPYAIDW